MSTQWLEAKVLDNRHWTDTLFSLRVAGPSLAFEAGQFVRLAMDIDGERIARPFSFVNPPADPVHEFYGIVVPGGPLSPTLARLQPGDTLYLAPNPAGFLVLSEVPDAEAPWRRFRNVVLVHAVRNAKELVYRDLILEISRKQKLRYVTFVSREPHPGALSGRIPAAVRDGRLEQAAGLEIAPESSQVLLCGNPDMLKDATAALMERGLRKHRRRNPGQISVESFW